MLLPRVLSLWDCVLRISRHILVVHNEGTTRCFSHRDVHDLADVQISNLGLGSVITKLLGHLARRKEPLYMYTRDLMA